MKKIRLAILFIALAASLGACSTSSSSNKCAGEDGVCHGTLKAEETSLSDIKE